MVIIELLAHTSLLLMHANSYTYIQITPYKLGALSTVPRILQPTFSVSQPICVMLTGHIFTVLTVLSQTWMLQQQHGTGCSSMTLLTFYTSTSLQQVNTMVIFVNIVVQITQVLITCLYTCTPRTGQSVINSLDLWTAVTS